VRVVPAPGSFDLGLLVDEVLPFLLPNSKCCGERPLVSAGQGERKPAQLDSRLSLRPPREILGHRLDLMEVADLHRNILENRG